MLRVLFAGTPDFAVPTLDALIHDSRICVEYVLTQPDRRSGRGQRISESAIKRYALEAGIPVRQPETLKNPSEIQWIKEKNFDAMVVVAFGQILTAEILESPRLGCLNVHASLLPRWRGAAPLQRCIEAGDSLTGVTIILMDEGLDTGPMLAKASTAITDQTTTVELHDRLAKLGGPLLVETLKQLADSNHQLIQQPTEGITYAQKVSTQHACIQWNRKQSTVMRQIHAFNPTPGAFTFAGLSRIKIFSVRKATGSAPSAGLLWKENQQILVSTKTGNLEVLDCQLPGGKRLAFEQLASHHSAPWLKPTKLTEQPT
ncbi:MAG: methionyl-tRNA formyltransferase [Gammaproteobacteria bacterium]|nr:methionyl-tRNA formyltransferase [Gammaproteobacteria bacterium]|tara:strand:+ start:683 stop:1630 length:948 start_codon:yes stop_codon:yes gene_type:complete